jgi:hypothetical protein
VTVRVRYPTRVGDVIITNVVSIERADDGYPPTTLRIVTSVGATRVATLIETPMALKVWP